MRKSKCVIKTETVTYNGKPFEFEYCETHDNIIGSVFGNKPFPDCELLKQKKER